MKPAPFEYHLAADVDDALAQLTCGDEVRLLAGGQSLLPMMALRIAQPARVVDIQRVEALACLRDEGKALRIGSMVRHVRLERNELIAHALPLLAQAMPLVAHPAVRNRGTLGGSLCLADPAAELPACMLALDAEMIVQGARGERHIAASDFFLGPYTTALAADEMLVAVRLPYPDTGTRVVFDEISRRHGDYAIVGMAALANPSGRCRLVYLGCGGRPVRAHGAEHLLRPGTPAPEISTLRQALAEDLAPDPDSQASAEMRLHLAAVLLHRAWPALAGDGA